MYGLRPKTIILRLPFRNRIALFVIYLWGRAFDWISVDLLYGRAHSNVDQCPGQYSPVQSPPPPEESPQCLSIVHDWPMVAGGQRGKYSTIGLTRFWSSLSFVVLSYPFCWIWCRGSQRTISQMASR